MKVFIVETVDFSCGNHKIVFNIDGDLTASWLMGEDTDTVKRIVADIKQATTSHNPALSLLAKKRIVENERIIKDLFSHGLHYISSSKTIMFDNVFKSIISL